MRRNPRKVAWTKAFRKARGKEMTIDSTFEFEKRRNIPVRYNRDLVQTTLKAMQRVGEIQARRERAFFNSRMAVARDKLRAVRSKKRAAREAKDKAYEEFIKKRDAEMEVSSEEEVTETTTKVDVELVQPETVAVSTTGVKERIVASSNLKKQLRKTKVRKSAGGPPSALIPAEGRTMGMETD